MVPTQIILGHAKRTVAKQNHRMSHSLLMEHQRKLEKFHGIQQFMKIKMAFIARFVVEQLFQLNLYYQLPIASGILDERYFMINQTIELQLERLIDRIKLLKITLRHNSLIWNQ